MTDRAQHQARPARHRRRGAGTIGMLLVSALMLSTVVACSSDTEDAPEDGAPELGLEEEAFAPSSPELIAAALEAGEIDEPTSLLYRTWAYFRDPQLPEQFIGDDVSYELGLLAEVRGMFDELPPEFQEQIEPYLLRPNDQASAFSATPSDDSHATSSPATASALQAGSALQVSAPAPTAKEKKELKRCTADWASQEVMGLGFRVWVCNDPAALAGLEPDDALDLMADMLYLYVPQMKADIGELIPDDPSAQTPSAKKLPPNFVADSLIDVYAMPSGWYGPWRQHPQDMPSWGRTVQSSPFAGATSSAYILLSLDNFDDRLLMERLVVHELFHAFQYTFNTGVNAPWWTEGSAEWAGSYYVREDSKRLHSARSEFVLDLQYPSVLRVDERPKYGGYIWPFFMEQQVGHESIIDAWHELGTLPLGVSEEAVIAVLDQQLNMAENYPELAVRLFNRQLQGDPISPMFQDLDPNYPTHLQRYMPEHTLDDEPLELDVTGLSGLGYEHYQVKVETPDDHPDDTGVLVRISGQAATNSGIAPVLQGLVRDTDGDYSRVPISYTGDGDTVCVDQSMFLVLANVSTSLHDITDGWLTLERLDGEPCTRIEVQDPNMFIPVFDGDIVQVDGMEGDDEPDDTQVVVTVRDPDPAKIDEYDVKVRVDGGTLNGARDFSWPLDSFDNIGDGVWRMIEDLPLDNDLDDTNRPLTIDTRLERSGDAVHQDSPTVELHGQQESMCFLEADITGEIWYQFVENIDLVYRPYPVTLQERYEPEPWLGFASMTDYEGTVMTLSSQSPSEPLPDNVDTFSITWMDFGKHIPEGKTGSFEVELTLAYTDRTNIPLETPEPGMIAGQDYATSETAMTKGIATFEVTKNLPSEGIFEGTITGVFTDEYAYDSGDKLDVELKFATADEC